MTKYQAASHGFIIKESQHDVNCVRKYDLLIVKRDKIADFIIAKRIILANEKLLELLEFIDQILLVLETSILPFMHLIRIEVHIE